MGYCMIGGGDATIKEENFPAALAAIKALAGSETIHDGSGKHFSWVDTETFLKADNIFDALAEWRWEAICDDRANKNDIVALSFAGQKLGDERILMPAIAPFVEDGGSLEMEGEDGAKWRYYFINGKCYEQDGILTYPTTLTDTDLLKGAEKNESENRD